MKKVWTIICSVGVILLCSAAQWVTVDPISRGSATQGTSLNDIDCRMPTSHIYRDSDKVTWAHETTHGLNSRLRQQHASANAFYVLNGHAFLVETPRGISLGQIAVATPEWMRGAIYKLYLVEQQRYWNDTPLYVFDELTAYVNGTVVGLQENMQGRAQESYTNALEMLGYSLVARTLIHKVGFQDREAIDEFLQLMIDRRIICLRNELEKRGWLLASHTATLKKLEIYFP